MDDDSSKPREDFEWVTTDEPHATRRKIMLTKEYAPKLRRLMGYDWTVSYWVVGLVVIQLSVAWTMRSAEWSRLLLAAYCIGGTCNHSLALAMHELAHNLAFGFLHCRVNRWFAWLANLPIGLPAASSFKKYHIEHHKYQGNSVIDADLPTEFEARFFHSTLGKTVWIILQPFFYGLRPLMTYPRPITRFEISNTIIQISFNVLVVYFMSWKSLVYLISGTILGYGIHPISGHFISEHYMFVKGIETYSYYGPLNWLTYNVGYHNEHHDFPNVPGRLLPVVRKTAPEFYKDLPNYSSWTKVLFDFATDPHVSIYSRIKRLPKAAGSAEQKPTQETAADVESPMSSPAQPIRNVKATETDALLDDGEEFVLRHRREQD